MPVKNSPTLRKSKADVSPSASLGAINLSATIVDRNSESGHGLTGARCQCAACRQGFNSVSTFDRHRRGKPGSRYCLTPAELRAAGWSRNAAGFWIERQRLDRAARSGDPAWGGGDVAGEGVAA